MKVALFGFGGMNKICLKYAVEQGHQVVAVIGRHNQGEDAGVVAGVDAINVVITNPAQAKEVLLATRPDVAIVATRSLLADVAESLLTVAECRVNAVTISEETFYSWNTNAEMTAKIDKAFRDNAATCTATGAQDGYWGHLPALMLGVTHKVDVVKGLVQYNVDEYGAALCEMHGANMTLEAFNEKFLADQQSVPSYVWASNEWLCGKMKWKVLSTTQKYEPIIAEEDIVSTSLGPIKAGMVIGLNAIVTTVAETRKGKQVTIITEQIGKCYGAADEDKTTWIIEGEPNLEIQAKKPDTVGITCASAVNRVGSVINARSGYVPSYELGLPEQF